MDTNRKFDMLSVVAFGIHTEVRQRIQDAIDKQISRPDLRGTLRPYFFYEYFLDTPIIFGQTSTDGRVAFAPFFKRLLIQRDFIAVPPQGFDRIELNEFSDLVKQRKLIMLPTREDIIAQHWPEPRILFRDAINKSLILKLLHDMWNSIDRANACRTLKANPTAHFLDLEVLPDVVDGVISMEAGFSSKIAQEQYLDQMSTLSGTELKSSLKECSAVIYPWLLALDPAIVADVSLCEIIACSVSSRSLFFGELILYVPSIADKGTRDQARNALRQLLREVVMQLYVPMLTLYENYAAEQDLDEISDDKLEKLSPNPEEKQFLCSVGKRGRPSSLIASSSVKGVVGKFPHNVFLQLVSLIPLDAKELHKELTSLEQKLTQRAQDGRAPGIGIDVEKSIEATTCVLVVLQEELGKVTNHNQWVDTLRSIAKDLLGALNTGLSKLRKDPSDHLDDLKDSVRDQRQKLVRFEQDHNTALSEMEKSLVSLWAHRIGSLPECLAQIKESLVFAKYLIASPGMVECIQQAMATRHYRKHKSVKAALVIGEAGSGKDSMARLVHLFSPGYRFGKKCTLNMAMLRPKEAAVPILIGLNANLEGGAPGAQQYSLKGLLAKAIDTGSSLGSSRAKRASWRRVFSCLLPGSATTKGTGEHDAFGFTFIFDELNSLDIDTQGALLRVLENGELTGLGSLEHEDVDFLVIGVMNEDPHLIMKKRNLDRVLRDKELFGGVVGESIYEMLRTQRRLRDDLYYRFARGGQIRIPELRDRREDIPILLYFIILQDFKQLMPGEMQDNWEIDFSVYEYLMEPSLTWEGNVRELQAVAKRLVEEAVKQYQRTPTQQERLVIRRSHAVAALGK